MLHTFAGDLPEIVRIPFKATKIDIVLMRENNDIGLADDVLEIALCTIFETVAGALL